MTPRTSFYRKLAYYIAIAVLLVPLSLLSRPASGVRNTEGWHPGGKLAKMRKEHNLAQANLGEIDPGSETMKLATLGMRGIAANLLWNQANEYKKKEDWTNLQATLNQVINLQPNFIKVWRFQAWNLSYNVSVELDDVKDRYHWVSEGIQFLEKGLKYNEDNPRLLWDIGWFSGNKIGRADERKEYRQMFKEDPVLHEGKGRSPEERDNWLVAKTWYEKACDAVDHGHSFGGKSELLYRADPAMAQINYADALNKDGVHGERSQRAWRDAARDWKAYSEMRITTSYGSLIKLKNKESVDDQAQQFEQQLDDLEPGLRVKMLEDRLSTLSEERRIAHETPLEQRTEQQHELASAAAEQLELSVHDVAEEVGRLYPDKAAEARRLAKGAAKAKERASVIRRYRDIVNFIYWRTRCEYEQTADANTAHTLIHEGEEAFGRLHLIEARDKYWEGLNRWAKIFEQFPQLTDKGLTGEDVVEIVIAYVDVLDQLDEKIPGDFSLREILEESDREDKLQGVWQDDPPLPPGEPPESEPSEEDSPETQAPPEIPGPPEPEGT